MTDEMEEIWLLYVDDGSQALDAVETALSRLKARAGDRDAVGLLFRSMHTFKGNSRILGLATIEHVAHVAEDLIGIVRDEGVPIDEEIVTLLMEAADALRGMMDRAYRSRVDEPADRSFDLPDRMKDKIARGRAALVDSPPSAAQSDPSAQADDDLPLNDALLFDPSEIRLADDPVYRKIFREAVRAALDRVLEASRAGEAAATREACHQALAEIGEFAQRIAIADWPVAVQTAEAELAAGGEPLQLIEPLEALLHHAVHAGNLPVAPTEAEAEAEAEPEAADEAADFSELLDDTPVNPPSTSLDDSPDYSVVPIEIIDTLRLLLDPADGARSLDAAAVKAITDRLADWANKNGDLGISEACTALAASWGTPEFEAATFRVAEFISRLEMIPNGAATLLFGKWSLGRVPSLLEQIADAVAGSAIDWDRIITSLAGLAPAFTSCGWYTAHDIVLLMTDLSWRARDGELISGSELPGLLQRLIAGLALAMSESRANGYPNFAAADHILDETATAAARLSHDPAIADLGKKLGLPEVFLSSLSAESAKLASEAIESGRQLHIIRADLGQDKTLAERFMSWLETPDMTIIASVTIFEQSTTAFDFLIATRESAKEVRAALSRITPDVAVLSLVSTLRLHEGEASGSSTAAAPSHAMLADAAALGDIIGELATARQITRQVLSSFVEADLPSRTGRILLDRADGKPDTTRDELTRLMGDWHERIEQLLQVEAKMASDLDQLSEIATRIRQRPVGQLLDELTIWTEGCAAERGVIASIACHGRECSIDVSHVAPLNSALRQAIELCLSQPGTGAAALEIRIAQGDTALEAFVIDRQWAAPDRTIAEGEPGSGAMTRTLDEILRCVAGYANIERAQGGGTRIRLVIPQQTSLIDGMIVRVRDTKYVLPVHSIQRIVETTLNDIVKVSAQSSQSLLKLSGDDVLRVQSLVQPGDEPDHGERQTVAEPDIMEDAARPQLFVIALTRDGRIAVPVDELLGQESIVVRPVQGYLASLHAVAGCTILAAGDVGMVVDPDALTRAAA